MTQNKKKTVKATIILFGIMSLLVIAFILIKPSFLGFINTIIANTGGENIKEQEMSFKDYNVILITLDTLRSDHLSCYGYEKNTAPNISSLAEQGVLFENAITQSSWTLPAHASILTGVYPHEHGAEKWQTPINKRLPMLQEILKQEDYSTAAFISTVYVSEKYGFNRGFDIFDSSLMMEKQESNTTYAKGITDKAIQWLKQNDNKFFLWLHYYDIHHPFVYHDDIDFEYFATIDPKTSTELTYLNWNIYPYKLNHFENDKEKYLSLYDGEIFYVDFYVNKIFNYLRDQDLINSTIIIITSDHGESFNNHRLVGHDNFLYSDLINVPLIIYIPDIRPKVEKNLVEIKDIMPTVLELLDVNKPDYVDESLFSTAKAKKQAYVFSEVHNRNEHRRIAVVHKDWKLIYTFDESYFELYNLRDDPEETHNLAKENPELVEKLKAFLFEAMGVVELDEETLDKLKSLGYIH